MNNNVKLLIGGLIGAGVGYFVGSVVVEIIALKENPDTDDYNDLEYPNTEDGGPEIDDENSGKELFQRSRTMTKREKRNYEKAFQANPELEKLVKKYNGGEAVEEVATRLTDKDIYTAEELEEVFDPEEDSGDIQPISIISMAEYAEAEGFETVTLNYYDDDVVTDQHDNPIDRPEDILGDEALVSFGELSGDEDVVYVRNLPKHAMYEVVRTNTNYAAQKIRRERREALARKGSTVIKEDQYGEENT